MDDRGERAAKRARAANRRAMELATRREHLGDEAPVTPQDVDRARRSADDAAERAGEAYDRASVAHTAAADLHRSAAALAEQMGQETDAARHRRAATVDDEAAREDRAAGNDSDDPSR